MQLYRFSPIRSVQELGAAIDYVARQESLLSAKIVGRPLPITYLTIFAHYEDEYGHLIAMLKSLGDTANANNGIKATLFEPITAGDQTVSQLRVRRPDPYRMQVGCCDFDVGDYAQFKATYLDGNKHLRLIERPEYEMIEFFDPEFDVLGYAISAPV